MSTPNPSVTSHPPACKIEVHALCVHCDAKLHVSYQPAQRRNATGRFVDRGGLLLATCYNPDCDALNITTMLNNHRAINPAEYK